jgi:hypothetical protein
VAGSVRLFGADGSARTLRRRIGYVPQRLGAAAGCRRPCRRWSPRAGWLAGDSVPYGGWTATRSPPPSPRWAWPTAPRRR